MTVDARRLGGSIVPLVTPFNKGAVDYGAFESSVERQIAAGSDGVVVTGTTGEPTSLSFDERAELYRRAIDVADGRLAVVTATGSSNHDETLRLTRSADRAGADAVLIVCPAFIRPSQDGLVAHLTAAASVTERPVLVYNIPGRTGVGVTTSTVERIVAGAPNVVGLKHASNELDLVTELLLRLGEDFRLFCGLESYSYPFLALGGSGLMSAVGNLAPELVKALCRYVDDGDHSSALALHRHLFPVNQAIFYETNPGPLKVMLASCGYGSEELRLPLAPVGTSTRERVLQALATLGFSEVNTVQ